MSVAQRELPGTRRDPLYPDSDGEPMGETHLHTIAVGALREAFEDLFAARGLTDAYVISQMVLYYRRGDPAGRRDPDVLIALGAGNHTRLSFRVWEEGRVPDVVFEISSESTVSEDTGTKRTIYEQQRIREYYLFDPADLYLEPSLQGFRLDEANHYQPIAPNADGSLDSPRLNVRLFRDGALLRVLDLATGKVVRTRGERAEDERERAEDERRLKEDAERRAANEKKLKEDAERRVADEKKRAEDAEQRAADEKKRNELLQAEIDRLKAQLEKKD